MDKTICNFFVLIFAALSIAMPVLGQEMQPSSTTMLGRFQKLEEENLELRKQILEMQKQILVVLQQNQVLYQQNLLMTQKLDQKIEEQTHLQIAIPIAYASGNGYPRSGKFISRGKTLVIFAFGSAWHTIAVGTMQVNITLDGTIIGALKASTNEVSSHKTLIPLVTILREIPAGEHSIELVQAAGTADCNDYSQVMVMELPY